MKKIFKYFFLKQRNKLLSHVHFNFEHSIVSGLLRGKAHSQGLTLGKHTLTGANLGKACSQGLCSVPKIKKKQTESPRNRLSAVHLCTTTDSSELWQVRTSWASFLHANGPWKLLLVMCRWLGKDFIAASLQGQHAGWKPRRKTKIVSVTGNGVVDLVRCLKLSKDQPSTIKTGLWGQMQC